MVIKKYELYTSILIFLWICIRGSRMGKMKLIAMQNSKDEYIDGLGAVSISRNNSNHLNPSWCSDGWAV